MNYSIRRIGTISGNIDETITFFHDKKVLKSKNICCDTLCMEVKSCSTDGKEFKCKNCNKHYSIRIQSFFSNVRITLQNLLLLIYFFAVKVPVNVAEHLLVGEISSTSIKQWYNFLREVCSQSLLLNPLVLGGPGKIVELDETCFRHKRKYNRGYIRGSGQKWIFGLLDISSHNCHLQLVENRERNTLFPIIRRHVAQGSEIHSDEASVYLTLNQTGYIH